MRGEAAYNSNFFSIVNFTVLFILLIPGNYIPSVNAAESVAEVKSY
jgi:hypothetical protein